VRPEPNVNLGLLIAQVDHGPSGGMAVVHLALVAVIVLGGLAFLLLRGARRGADRDVPEVSDRNPESDQEPEP
jgi:hypothetical protein